MKSRHQRILALSAAAIVAVPLGVTASMASWKDSEWAHGQEIGTSSFACGEDLGYSSQASGRFLAGDLLGIDLDEVAALEPMALSMDAGGAVAVSPPGAINLGSPPPTYTYANPLNIDALSGLIGLDLTGLEVGLPVGSLGAVNQFAQVAGTGAVAGAAGLISNSGGVLVGADTPDDQLPEPAKITLDDLLPGVSGLAGVDLTVGAVASSATLDGCAALKSALWGDDLVTGVVRDYGVAGLGLSIDSPAVKGITTTVNSAVTQTGLAVDALVGSSGLISNAVLTGIDIAIPALLTTSIGGTVKIEGLDLPGAVSSILTQPLGDGVVSIDLASGTINVDLDALLPSLNDAPPNTEVVINQAVLAPIVTRVGNLLNALTTQIVNALTAELNDAKITIDLAAVVRAVNTPILNVSVDFVGTIGALRAPGATLTVDVEVIGAIGLVNILLTSLGLPSLTTIINGLLGIGTTLAATIAGLLTSTVFSVITTLGTTLSTTVNGVVAGVGTIVNALPNVLSVMVNVQPDQPGAPPGTGFIDGGATSTPQYLVSALRIGLADFLTPASVAHVTLATASAGPVQLP